ncbi:hypothetical protein CK203_026040 [Vitis vinifera]|uniref:Reverse transcriptase/retrotransposon-derived protein RNase H-like domain-containing protein n=1 Tax=Vitis vinifera TaxID=29760 RepID=A0A438IJG3_VITVI|nr:hypothetical protein CK203_026040 [Vitis vinifera]
MHEAKSFKCAFGEQEGITAPHGQTRRTRAFYSPLHDELRPFFLAIRKAGANGWTDSCQNAFEKIKHCLTQPPILSSPIPKEKLYMYLAVSEWAISAVLFRCPSPKEKPIYYVSSIGRRRNQVFKNGANSLSPSKRCPKLRPISKPTGGCADRSTLRNILHKPDLTGRMRSRSRASATIPNREAFGASHPAGIPASNNEAEYEAILSGLDLALALSVSKLRIYSDAQLVLPPSLSKKPFYCLYMCNQPLCRRISTCNTIEANQANAKNGTTLQNISGQALYPEIPNRHTNPGASCPFHPDWGAPVQAILHRTLPSVPRAFRGPVCSHSTYVVSNIEVNLKPMTLCAMGHGHSGTPPSCTCPKEFLLVATDYFSKWVEAEAYASIKTKMSPTSHSGISVRELNIRNSYSTPRYPQSNGQAEAHKQNSDHCLKEKARTSQREMGGGATWRLMGLSNHTRTTNRKYSFHPRHTEWTQ